MFKDGWNVLIGQPDILEGFAGCPDEVLLASPAEKALQRAIRQVGTHDAMKSRQLLEAGNVMTKIPLGCDCWLSAASFLASPGF